MPVDLKPILDNKKKSNAKRPTKSIEIKPVIEKSQASLKNVCLNFVYNAKTQMGIPIKNIEELKNINSTEFKVITDNGKFYDYILNNDVYVYANLDDELHSKIALPKGNMVMVKTEIKRSIKINDRIYYNHYFVTRTKEKEIISIGKGINWNIEERKINFKFKGTLEERIKDMQFCKDLIESGILSVNDVDIRLPINNQKNSKWFKRVLQDLVDLKMIDKKLKEFNVKFESDIDELEEQDIKNLFMFMNIFCKDKVPKSLHIKREGLNCIKIGKYNIAVWCQYEKEKLKFYNYFSDLKNVVRVMLVDDNEKPNIENTTSPYLMLNEKDLLEYSNFNDEVVRESFNIIKDLKSQSIYINRFMLNILKAYDKDNSRADLLNLAESICEKLLINNKDVTNIINKFQIIRRRRNLTIKEKNELQEIKQKILKDDLFKQNECGIAILLGNEFDYEYYYKRMTKEERKEFDEYPISNLLNNTSKNKI